MKNVLLISVILLSIFTKCKKETSTLLQSEVILISIEPNQWEKKNYTDTIGYYLSYSSHNSSVRNGHHLELYEVGNSDRFIIKNKGEMVPEFEIKASNYYCEHPEKLGYRFNGGNGEFHVFKQSKNFNPITPDSTVYFKLVIFK